MGTLLLHVLGLGLIIALPLSLSYVTPRILASKWQNLKSNALRENLVTAAFKGDDFEGGEAKSDFSGLVTLLRGTSVNKNTKKSGRRRERNMPTFKRTTRVDGLKVWVKELGIIQEQMRKERNSPHPEHLKALKGVGVVVELAKELFYSGIPEQVLELYAAYYDILNDKPTEGSVDRDDASTNPSEIVVIDSKLVLITVRAFLALSDVNGALTLLGSCTRMGMTFDMESNSILIKELAEKSLEGLRAALGMYERVMASQRLGEGEGLATQANDGERLSAVAYAGLLHGIYMHGTKKPTPESALLVHKGDEAATAAEPGMLWRMPLHEAEDTGDLLLREYLADVERSGAKVNYKVLQEYLRLSHRLGALRAKLKLNSNFEIDALEDQQERAKEGMRQAILVMEKYSVAWTSQICDALIGESLRYGDVASVEFTVAQMRANQLVSRTSTFNALLKQYSESFDGESAFYLLQDMKATPQTQPNVESYRLALKACSRDRRSEYFCQEIVKELKDKNKMFKGAWDRYCEQKVAVSSTESLEAALLDMVQSGTQPDDDTVIMLYDAYKRTGNIEGALRLYRNLARSEIQRRWFRDTLTAYKGSNVTVTDVNFGGSKVKQLEQSDSAEQAEASGVYSYLPPPSLSTCNHLLEILRDEGLFEASGEVLSDMNERCWRGQKNVPVTTQGGRLGVSVTSLSIGLTSTGHGLLRNQFAPDRTSHVLGMEACLNLRSGENEEAALQARAQVALDIFAQMETAGIGPDRRVYASLVKVFGLLQNDVSSALGVFHELTSAFVPDVENLQSILEVCRRDPMDLRTICVLLEDMSSQEGVAGTGGINLDVFSKDVLMQMFPDALTLGRVLEQMEQQKVPRGTECVYAGISVLSVLAQGIREKNGIEDVIRALQFLGRCGIRPDSETMEYFRPVEAPERNSFGSKAHFKLQPHKLKQRSLMDISKLADAEDECPLPERGFQRSQRSRDIDRKSYEERGVGGAWAQHEAALRRAIETDEEWAGAFDEAEMADDDGQESERLQPHQLPVVDNKQVLSNLAEASPHAAGQEYELAVASGAQAAEGEWFEQAGDMARMVDVADEFKELSSKGKKPVPTRYTSEATREKQRDGSACWEMPTKNERRSSKKR